MSGVTLRLDGARWREHLGTVRDATPGLVPVIKGNGYGFGLARLAEESAALGVDTVAAGMPTEVEWIREGFDGDIVVLYPYDSRNPIATDVATDPQVITTVSRLTDLQRLREQVPGARVLVEVLTSMRRHGIAVDALGDITAPLADLQFEGWTIHLPLLPEGGYEEAERLGRAALGNRPGPLWLSHLASEEAETLARQLGSTDEGPAAVRLRVGTRLWLGDASSRATTATVLDVHSVRRGDRAGYRQRRVPADGWVVVVSGGTSHGVGLEAPTSASTVRQRAIAVATGSLEAAGLALSPYTVAGRKRWFLEPPHMQASQLFLPRKVTPPSVGDEVSIELRLTTAGVDQIITTEG